MAKYYETITVNGTANTEVIDTLVTSTQTEKKHINRMIFTEVTGTAQNNAVIYAYVAQKRIVNMPIQHFLMKAGASDRPSMEWLNLDFDLPVGQSLDVGTVSGATASNFIFTVEYELI